MNRTIKEATVKRFHCDSRSKTLSGLTPGAYACKVRIPEPHQFILDPIHQRPGPNS